jgi:hypothetical protein
MKTRNKMVTRKAAIMLCIVATLISCSDGGGNNSPPPPPPEQPMERTTGTTKDLSFGTNCKVTIKGVAGEKYLNAEWNTLCDKVVAAIERGYNSAPNGAMKTGIETYFTNNPVSVVLLKSAIFDCEVRTDVPKTMYLKANASAIDGISGDNLFSAIDAMFIGDPYPTP